jgi:hypothetical protein
MTLPENIFNLALDRLMNGESIQSISADYPDYQQELEGLLSVAQMGLNIPQLAPPAPYKRYLFKEKAVTSSWFMEIFQYGRVAIIPISLVAALIGGRAMVNATEDSLPGDRLYSIKRATEEARLTITRDQAKIAYIHVELMQKRLADVKKAASSGNEASETAAIEALQTQSDKTFEETAPLATANAISKQDSSLLDSLVAVNKEQKDVLANLSETSETDSGKTIAINALEVNKKNDETLAKIIATVNDQALIDLPNKISVTGEVSYHYNNKVIVEKNTFSIDNTTLFIGVEGESISQPELLQGRVTVTGTKLENGLLLAKQILLLPYENGEVKGEVDVNPINPAPTIKPKPTTEPAPTNTPVPTQPAPTDPNKATGSFIVEPSAQQYSQ